ncbi:hypothetical protein P7C73_g4912, partial [Tremellales sp. Uapishka_1]
MSIPPDRYLQFFPSRHLPAPPLFQFAQDERVDISSAVILAPLGVETMNILQRDSLWRREKERLFDYRPNTFPSNFAETRYSGPPFAATLPTYLPTSQGREKRLRLENHALKHLSHSPPPSASRASSIAIKDLLNPATVTPPRTRQERPGGYSQKANLESVLSDQLPNPKPQDGIAVEYEDRVAASDAAPAKKDKESAPPPRKVYRKRSSGTVPSAAQTLRSSHSLAADEKEKPPRYQHIKAKRAKWQMSAWSVYVHPRRPAANAASTAVCDISVAENARVGISAPIRHCTSGQAGERGFGLFADEDIKTGDFVIDYRGEVVSKRICHSMFQDRMNDQYAGETNFYALAYDQDEYLDSGMKGNEARFINHGCEPNLEVLRFQLLGDGSEEYEIGMWAIRDIAKGEELFYDYNFETFELPRTSKYPRRVSTMEDRRKKCTCGAPTCRGFLGKHPRDKLEDKSKVSITKWASEGMADPSSQMLSRRRDPKNSTIDQGIIAAVRGTSTSHSTTIRRIPGSTTSSGVVQLTGPHTTSTRSITPVWKGWKALRPFGPFFTEEDWEAERRAAKQGYGWKERAIKRFGALHPGTKYTGPGPVPTFRQETSLAKTPLKQKLSDSPDLSSCLSLRSDGDVEDELLDSPRSPVPSIPRSQRSLAARLSAKQANIEKERRKRNGAPRGWVYVTESEGEEEEERTEILSEAHIARTAKDEEMTEGRALGEVQGRGFSAERKETGGKRKRKSLLEVGEEEEDQEKTKVETESKRLKL